MASRPVIAIDNLSDPRIDVYTRLKDREMAAMDASGALTALKSGFTNLKINYRESNIVPGEQDEIQMDITVVP